MKRRTQRGGSTLAAVMLLLALGLMLLNAQHRQLDNALLLAADQQRYLQAYNQAASALSWGMSQRWPRAELSAAAWLCRQRVELTACARLSTRAGVVTVRGLGEMHGGSRFGCINGACLTMQRLLARCKRSQGAAGFLPREKAG